MQLGRNHPSEMSWNAKLDSPKPSKPLLVTFLHVSKPNGNFASYTRGGNCASTAPFTTSNASSPAVTTYTGDSTVNFLQMPNGQKIQLNVPGDQIFSGTRSNDVFAALNSLVDDYSSGTANTAKAASDSQALSSALNYVSRQRVVIDNSITHLTTASDAVTNEQTQLIAAQANLMQADVAHVATQLSLAAAQQAALEDVITELGLASNSLFSKM